MVFCSLSRTEFSLASPVVFCLDPLGFWNPTVAPFCSGLSAPLPKLSSGLFVLHPFFVISLSPLFYLPPLGDPVFWLCLYLYFLVSLPPPPPSWPIFSFFVNHHLVCFSLLLSQLKSWVHIPTFPFFMNHLKCQIAKVLMCSMKTLQEHTKWFIGHLLRLSAKLRTYLTVVWYGILSKVQNIKLRHDSFQLVKQLIRS